MIDYPTMIPRLEKSRRNLVRLRIRTRDPGRWGPGAPGVCSRHRHRRGAEPLQKSGQWVEEEPERL